MKTCTFASILVCLATSVGFAATGDSALKWQKDYGSSKQQAQAARRPMLLVLEDSADKAKTLDVSTLKDTQREILTRDKFELVRVDVSTDYGKAVAKAFGAKVFPYTVVTDDASKRIVFRKPGAMSEQDWTLALGKNIRAQLLDSEYASPSQGVGFGMSAGGTVILQQPSFGGTCFT